jgi:hypothetical protein
MMDQLHNLKGKIPPAILPYFELVLLWATSFYYNCVASIRSIYSFASSYQTVSLNASTFNQFINKEVNKSNNKNVFNIGVWLSTVYICYCTYLLLWYVLFGLIFVLLAPTICWILLWGVVTFVKEKFLKDKYPTQAVKEFNKAVNQVTNQVANQVTNLDSEIVNKLNLEKDNKFD